MEVAIVILNWNGKHWLEKFLPSVVSHLNPKRDVLWVADNASTDDSIEWLKAKYPNVELLEMKENTGYAGGYHKALNTIEADYYVLLNSDIEVGPNWLDPMIDRMNNHTHIAACQPKILSYNNTDSFEYAGAVEAISIDWVIPFAEDVFSITAKRMKGNIMKPSPFFGRLEPALLCDQVHIIALADFMHLFSHIWKRLIFAGDFSEQVLRYGLSLSR